MEGGLSPSAGTKSQLMTSGGIRQTFGGGINEAHLDEAAAQSSAQNKQQNQQTSVLGQKAAVKQLAQNQGAGQTELAQTPEKIIAESREVSDLSTELIKRPVEDVTNTLKSIFNLNRLLEINSGDTVEEQAKKKQLASRWQQLTVSEQAVVKQKYEESLAKKRREAAEEEDKKRQEQMAKTEELPMPRGRQTGFQGFAGMSGSKKAKTILRRQQTTLGGAE